jgi:hypothetical protein
MEADGKMAHRLRPIVAHASRRLCGGRQMLVECAQSVRPAHGGWEGFSAE